MSCEQFFVELWSESEVKSLKEAHSEDKKYIDMLERKLRNYSQEIGYLREELNLRNIEANWLGEHVHSLELKLAENGKLDEKITKLTEELSKCDSERMSFFRALKHKEMELQTLALRMERIETAISSTALDSECEIESMKLDLHALEQSYLKAQKLNEEVAQQKVNVGAVIEDLRVRLEGTELRIKDLQDDNRELHEKLMKSENNATIFCDRIDEHLGQWLMGINQSGFHVPRVSGQWFHPKLENEISRPEYKCACEEVLGPFLAKLAVQTTWDETLGAEMQKLSNHIHESELLIKQLKEELREEKINAKEQAEDLTQEMAELRYQITDMLEQECKRRASIEQASVQRISELEMQVQNEQRKSSMAIRRFNEAQKLAEARIKEICNLKSSLVGFHSRKSLSSHSQKTQFINCGDFRIANLLDCLEEAVLHAEIADEATDNTKMDRPALAWYLNEVDGRVSEDIKTGD